MLNIFIMILKILIPLLVCMLILINKNLKEKTLNAYNKTLINIQHRLKQRKTGQFSYREIDRKLKSKGAYYVLQEHINPAIYMVIKVLTTLLFVFMSLSFSNNVILIIALGTLGFFLFDILLAFSNNNDNEEMLSDIKDVVDILKIQTNAGIHLSESLITCYRTVKNKRLKYELIELVNNIMLTNDIETSIRSFNTRFDNEYIDMICVMILQAQESGYSVQIMKDMSTQLSDLQKAINIKRQESLDRKVQLLELLVFVGLLGTCIYGMALELTKALKNI